MVRVLNARAIVHHWAAGEYLATHKQVRLAEDAANKKVDISRFQINADLESARAAEVRIVMEFLAQLPNRPEELYLITLR